MLVQIVENPDYTNLIKVGIQGEPDFDPLKFFLTGIGLQNLPVLIQKVMMEEGYGAEKTAVLYHSDLDGYDIASGNGFGEDEVEVYHLVFGDIVLKKKEFAQIIYAYAQKVLEVYQDSPHVDQEWHKNLEESLQAFRQVILFKS